MRFLKLLGALLLLSCFMTACSDPPDTVTLANPANTLQVTIPYAAYARHWAKLEPDSVSRLRLSYAPNRKMSRETVLAFDLLDIPVSEDIPLDGISQDIYGMLCSNYSDVDFTSEDPTVRSMLIGERPAMQYATTLQNDLTAETVQYTVIVAEGDAFYIIITILGAVEIDLDSSDSPLRAVLETLQELPADA